MGAVDGAPRRSYTGTVHSAICTNKEAEMIKPLAAIAILAGIASLAAVACGGGDEEDAAAPPPAAAAPAAESQDTGAVRSGVTGVDENGVIQYSIYVIGGGGTGGEKQSAQYGAANFGYDVKEIRFKVGDTVLFTAIPTRDVKQQHTFGIFDFGAITRMKFGNSGEVTVTFDKPGRFPYRCEIHAGEGEAGNIIVE